MKTLHETARELHSQFEERRLFAQRQYDCIDRRRLHTSGAREAENRVRMYADLIDTLLPYLDK